MNKLNNLSVIPYLVISEGGDLLRSHCNVGPQTFSSGLEYCVVICSEAHLE